MRLLVAEDDKALGLFLKRGLEADGHRVRLALDGAAAVDAFREDLPDLTILDLNLPKKDGRAVLAEVKADPVLRKIPIVIFSTSEARQDIERSYELGANCYVSKPGNLQGFISAVTSIGEFWFGLAHLPREEER